MQQKTKIAIAVGVGVVALIVIIAFVVVATRGSPEPPPYDKEPWLAKDTRLPSNIRAEKYRMFLDITWDDWTYTGSQEVTMSLTGNAKYFLMHSKGLVIDDTKTKLMDIKGKELKLTGAYMDTTKKSDSTNNFYIVESVKVLTEGTYKMKIFFSGAVHTKILTGMYRSKYVDVSDNTIYQISTDFEPVDARTAFPCFDEPDQKGTWETDITVKFPAGMDIALYTVISNAPLKDDYVRDGTTLTAAFKESVAMSTYLVCFAVSNLQATADTYTRTDGSKVELRVFARRDAKFQKSAVYALGVTKIILGTYEDFYKVNYPLPKLDQIAMPEFNSGAMENWGIITYRESSLLFDPDTGSQKEKQRVCAVVAHELAHQWFGNIVTMAWWSDLWLNEGFASFVEYYGINAAEPDWKIFDFFYADELTTAMDLDSSPKSHPISVEVTSADEIGGLFDTISYRKGASINWMMQKFMGEDNFSNGIQKYLKNHEWGNAEMVELFEALTEAAPKGMNVTEIMLTWTKQMGFPYVNVLKADGENILLTQHRFLNGEADPSDTSPFDYKWHIPFTYMTKDDAESDVTWIKPGDVAVEIPGTAGLDWIKGNAAGNYYYIVNYSEGMWGKLSTALAAGDIKSTVDRVSLIYDVFNLARVGKTKYTAALDMCTFAKDEPEYIVLSRVLSEVISAARGAFDEDATAFTKYKVYIKEMLQLQVTTLGWTNPSPGTPEPFTASKMRSMVLRNYCAVVGLKTDSIVAEALTRFDTFVLDNDDVEKDLLSVIVRTAILYDDGAGTYWDQLWTILQNSDWEADQRIYIAALAKSKNEALLRQMIKGSFGEDAKAGTWRYLYYVNVYGRQYDLAWELLQANWDKYAELYSSTSFTMGYLAEIPEHFNTQAKYDEVKTFFDSKKDSLGTGAKTVEETLAKIKTNIAWHTKYGAIITGWFDALP